MKHLISFIAIFLMLNSCKKQDVAPMLTPKPIADFSWIEGTGGDVKFTNSSKNATSYQWDFGDNSKATSESPSHTFIYKGVFTVKLIAKSDVGEAVAENTVQIKTGKDSPPNPDFTFVETKGEIQFTNTTKFGETYTWDFGDGTVKGIEKDPKHKYTANQIYDVVLNAKGKGGEVSITKKVEVKTVPEPIKISISKITVAKFPPNKLDGSPWDGCCTSIDARPDIYPTLLYGKSEIWSGEKIYVKDANPNVIYGFVVNPFVEIRFPKEKYTIALYDAFQAPFDGGYPMGGLSFTPTDLLKGFPTKVKITCQDCTIEYEIELKYEY